MAVSHTATKLHIIEPPRLAYWEYLWNDLHSSGWQLNHRAESDSLHNDPLHLVRAERGTQALECLAPSMTQAVEMLYRSICKLDC